LAVQAAWKIVVGGFLGAPAGPARTNVVRLNADEITKRVESR